MRFKNEPEIERKIEKLSAFSIALPPEMIVARFPAALTEHINLNKDGLVDELEGMVEAGEELGRLISS